MGDGVAVLLLLYVEYLDGEYGWDGGLLQCVEYVDG